MPFEMIPLPICVPNPCPELCISLFTADSALNTSVGGKNVALTQSGQPLQTNEGGKIWKSWPQALVAKMLARFPFYRTHEAESTMLTKCMFTKCVKGSHGTLTGFLQRLGILFWGQFHRVLHHHYKSQSETQPKVYNAGAMLTFL